jgi:hypothetical protein
MGLNIIVRSGSKGRVSDSEVSESLAKRIDAEQSREKAGYKERSRRQRAEADKLRGGKNFKPVAVYDMATYMRHEQQNPGCMSDPQYKKDFLKANPECKLNN